MGQFHCPIGAVGYRSEGCITCGLCIAATTEDAIKATETIRAYIRKTSALRHKKRVIQKIAVCGKGGAGKSTVTALLALVLVDYGYRVLVIDTDDSNMGLGRKLGLENPRLHLISCMERFSMENAAPEAGWLTKEPLLLEDIPEEFLSSDGNLYLMTAGKVENPLQGCACAIGDFTKQILSNLEPAEKDIVIVDQDAGIESFGRGVEQGVDTLITVVEPSFDSVELAQRIQFMAEGLGIRRIRAIINKVSEPEQDEIIRDMLSESEIRFLGSLFTNAGISSANLRGLSVRQTSLWPEAQKIAALMLDEAEMTYTSGNGGQPND